VLQTEKGEKRRNKNYEECDKENFPRQEVSTDSLAFVNSKI